MEKGRIINSVTTKSWMNLRRQTRVLNRNLRLKLETTAQSKYMQSRKMGEQVTHTQPFAAKIQAADNGNKKLVVRNSQFYQSQINKFEEGEEVTLSVSNRKPRRTIQQNRYYWGAYLPMIADETGEDNTEYLHEYFKGKFLTEKIIEVLGSPVRIKKSTKKLNTKEFSDYIRAIEVETGVSAPPTEDYGLESL